MRLNTSGAFGDYSAAKLDYLSAAAASIDPESDRLGGIGVNYSHCRPLHPHGYRMVRDGLMRLDRHSRGGGKCFISVLIITEEGLAELSRLKKRAAKRARRHEEDRDLIDVRLGRGRKGTPVRRSKFAKQRLTKAIAFSKGALRAAQA